MQEGGFGHVRGHLDAGCLQEAESSFRIDSTSALTFWPRAL